MSQSNKKQTILGQDPEILKAMLANLLSWLVSKMFPFLLSTLLPHCSEEEEEEEMTTVSTNSTKTKCVSIGRPGGLEQLRVVTLKDGIATCGYNVKHFCLPPFTPPIPSISNSNTNNANVDVNSSIDIPADCLVLKNKCFSVNYADCSIRWGLYESANRFVGWPIVPGFDVAGTVEAVSSNNSGDKKGNYSENDEEFAVGDRVFGCTLFGAYSNRVLIPKRQLRKIPKELDFCQAASLPAVALTAIYALNLAGKYPKEGLNGKLSNKAILIHSAAGGVGSMLVQMSKILGLSPVVGVVGSESKISEAKALGCDVIIDKSREDLWKKAEEACPLGYSAIMDANGVSTLKQSYEHLAPTGRLVVFGFHTNLPMGATILSPMEWIKMARKMTDMPQFDPFDMVTGNKCVLGFNLSFFADETEVLSEMFDQVCVWLREGSLRCPKVTTMDMKDIGKAHQLIQSGLSVGKIVIQT